MVTTCIILPFFVAKRGGQLVPCPPHKAKDAARAIAAAEGDLHVDAAEAF